MEETSKHESILTEEIVNLLQPQSGKVYFDGTFGGGGHARAILEAAKPKGRLVAVDRDCSVQRFAQNFNGKYAKRFEFHCMPYSDIAELETTFDGAVLDLGLSSDQLEERDRGFSYTRNEPLDMRFDREGQSAAQFLQQARIHEIEKVFREYGEDRYAKKLAAAIVNNRRSRPIKTTQDFIRYVGTDNPKVLAPLFQALRIQVNEELYLLEKGLQEITARLNAGAVFTVITFHSLEDRIVKQFFRSSGQEVLTKKPIVPSEQEVARNPRSRSAKLRAIRIRS